MAMKQLCGLTILLAFACTVAFATNDLASIAPVANITVHPVRREVQVDAESSCAQFQYTFTEEHPWMPRLCEQAYANRIEEFDVLIIAFANYAYRDVALNWAAGVVKLGIEKFLILALDNDAEDYFTSKGIPSVSIFDVPHEKGPCKRCIWDTRVSVFNYLLEWDVNFISSDVDAFWIRNPLPWIHTHAESYDIIGSRGYLPRELSKYWGGAICCGFFYLRATEASREFMNIVINDSQYGISKTRDDQISFNRAVDIMFPRWSPHPSGLGIEGVTRTARFRVLIMAEQLVSRNCRRVNARMTHTLALHCRASGKNGDSKERLMRSSKTWLLRSDWKTLPYSGEPMTEWISRATNQTEDFLMSYEHNQYGADGQFIQTVKPKE